MCSGFGGFFCLFVLLGLAVFLFCVGFWWYFSQRKPYIPKFCLGRMGIVGVIVLTLCNLLCYSQLRGWQHWLCYSERDQIGAENSTGMWYFSPLPLPVDRINVIETAEEMRFLDAISGYCMENLARKAREGKTRFVLVLRMPKTWLTWLGTLWVKSNCVTATIILWD